MITPFRKFCLLIGVGALLTHVVCAQSARRELRSGDRWLRLNASASDTIELSAGLGAETCATYPAPLGVAWYRNDRNLPDGERHASWHRFEESGDPSAPWTLFGEISDPAGGSWTAATKVRVDGTGFRLVTTFTRHGPARAASVRIHTRFTAPPSRAYTLSPGAIYNGNRSDVVVPRGYCPLPTEFELATRETGLQRRVIADIPRQDASTWWTVHLWGYQAASASVSTFDPEHRVGAHLGYARTDGPRVLGVIHTADPVANFHQVTVENPSVRARRYHHCEWIPSKDRPYRFNNGETALVELRLVPVAAEGVPAFISTLQDERALRRRGLAPGQHGIAPGIPDVMPRSYATQLAVGWVDRHRWNKQGFYRNGEVENPRELVLGWGHGTAMMLGLFQLGDEQVKTRIRRMTELVLKEAQAPGGLFYGVRFNGHWLGADGNLDSFWAMNSLTSRRTTDTVYFALDIADALRAAGSPADRALADRVDAAMLRACEALVRIVTRDGNLPFLLDARSERAVWPGGFGGARAIGALVRGAGRWNRPEFLATAKSLAALYAREGLARGDLWGGPSDVMQGTSDNESLTALAEGLTLLHGVTREPVHLRWAEQAADLLATWALDEHIVFPTGSLLARNGVHPFGSLVANTQNSWGTPGLCVSDGKFLLDLYERTGHARHLDLLSDISRMPMQMMVRSGQQWGKLEPGQMTECASFSDVSNDFGDAYVSSAVWPVNAMLISEVALPSIYVDGQRVWRFDHVSASVDGSGLVTVGNPTSYLARIRVQWRGGATVKLSLAPGATVTCSQPKS
jgi:hypothetical protein